MPKFREDLSLEYLLAATDLLHQLKPDVRDKVVVAIEQPRADDHNVVFHMMSLDATVKEVFVVMLSAQLIVDLFS